MSKRTLIRQDVLFLKDKMKKITPRKNIKEGSLGQRLPS